jgi:hypothetical protein
MTPSALGQAPLNYMMVHTPVAPNYSFLQAENAYLRQALEWRDAMLVEQQNRLTHLHSVNAQLQHDAQRWAKFKGIIDKQQGELTSQQLQNIVDTGNRNG